MTRLTGTRYTPAPAPAGRSLAWLPILVIILLVVGASGGWWFHRQFTAHPVTVCGVVTDTSTSVGHITTPGLRAKYERSLIESHLPGFLTEENCDTVRLAAVTGDSQRDACPVAEIAIQPPKSRHFGESGRRAYLDTQRKSVLTSAEQMAGVATGPATCASGVSGSDVLGALKRVAEGRPRPSRVVVFSDLAESARSLDGDSLFYGAPPKVMTESPERLAAALRGRQRLPDLREIHLTVHGGCQELPHDGRRLVTYERCNSFWTKIFAGAEGVEGWGK
jgi:hypothetical protein